MEMYIGMLGEQGHGGGSVGNFFGDHQGGEAHAERIVVHAGVPDADLFGFPCFDGADAARLRGHGRDVTAATRARVLDHRHGMQIDNARF